MLQELENKNIKTTNNYPLMICLPKNPTVESNKTVVNT